MPPTRLSTRARSLVIGAVLLALPAVTVTPSVATADERPRAQGDATAAQEQPDRPYPNIDVRGNKRLAPTAEQLRAARELDATAVRWGRFGTPRLLTPQGRTTLTAAGTTIDPRTLALDHIRDHAALYGLSAAELDALTVVTSYRTEHNGVRHVFIGQSDRGVPVHGARLSVAVDKAGRILTATGSLVPGARATGKAALGKAAALDRAAASVGTVSGPRSDSRTGTTATATATGTATATRVTFPLADGTARPAWRTALTADNGRLYDIVVDAETGTVLQRTDLTSNEGPEGRVHTDQNPTLGGATTVPFSGLGRSWVTGRVTTGNNGEVSHDPDGREALGHQPQTPAAGDPAYQHFTYTFTDAFRTSGGTDLTTDRDAVVTQAFYYANRMHDHLYALGFDEASGNFQEDNLGNGGAGGDRVQVYVDFDANGDSACNADFATPADGQNPTMRLFVGRASCDNHDIHRAMNGDTVAHEYSHGLSHRLVGGGDMGDGVQTGALGEGWSDAVATSLWNDPVYGEYNNGRATGIRRVAYNNSTLTYGDLCDDGSCSVHSDGEIWATTMWDMRTALVGAYGYAAGKQRHEQLMVDGMKMTPSSPDFLDARDGILAADRANHGGADQCLLWGVFARRGMGASASSPSQDQANPATDFPASCRPTADAGGPYTTEEGADVRLDASGSTVPGGGGGYSWDFDGDGAYDDATGAAPLFDRVGRDGTYTVGLRVGNAAGADTDTATVTVTNVAPSVDFTVQGPREEGGRLTVSGTVTDPGWLDPLTATIDPGDGKPVPLAGQSENDRPDATLTFSREVAFGDNGTFTVKICGSDDDTSTCRETGITVADVDPAVALDKAGTVPLAGGRTLVVHKGEEKRYTARITDPGSDDETMSWTWGDGTPPTTTTSLVNPPETDPARSPSVQPRDLTDIQVHAYTKPCLYDLSLAARDDDGGAGTDGMPVIVQGNAPLSLLADIWYVKYLTGDLTGLGKETLDCYLKIVQHASAVFSEKVDVSTQDKAADVLFLNLLLDPKRSLDRQLLAAWLNFANGAFEANELVDTDGDLKADTPFLQAVQNAERVRLDPQATKQRLSAQAAILTCINVPLV
ncbi:M36 family metallopeptidase [Streptomyces sp. NPDC001930]|uniref:M36 family metallopeptidase n=1 Tax=Streptomyces sp. NPDC001930 TaxID=3364625 RepID=UPI0036AC644D